MKTVAIIDYKISNLYSVRQACLHVGLEPVVTSNAEEIRTSDAVILPGVGSFGEGMKNIKELRLLTPIIDSIKSKKPFMGICLGYQLLFTESEEFGLTKGLGVYKGKVKRFSSEKPIKVPQVGWNTIAKYDDEKWEQSLLKNVSDNEFFYFVHSFYVDTDEKKIILSKTNYGGTIYCSSIQDENVFASQFHPEKSADEGLKIYRNFANQIKERL